MSKKLKFLLNNDKIFVEQMMNRKRKGFSYIIAFPGLSGIYFFILETALALFALDTVVSLHSVLPKSLIMIQSLKKYHKDISQGNIANNEKTMTRA